NDDFVARVRIPSVDAVAVKRDVRGLAVGRQGKIVRVGGNLEGGALFVGERIEKTNGRAQLVDQQQAARAGRVVGIRAHRRRQRCIQQHSSERALDHDADATANYTITQ